MPQGQGPLCRSLTHPPGDVPPPPGPRHPSALRSPRLPPVAPRRPLLADLPRPESAADSRGFPRCRRVRSPAVPSFDATTHSVLDLATVSSHHPLHAQRGCDRFLFPVLTKTTIFEATTYQLALTMPVQIYRVLPQAHKPYAALSSCSLVHIIIDMPIPLWIISQLTTANVLTIVFPFLELLL